MFDQRLPGPAAAAAAGAIATLLVLLSGCGKKELPAAAQAPPVEVRVIASRAETVPVVNKFVGRIAAYRSVEVRARVEGILEKRHFVEGTEVRRGDLLAQRQLFDSELQLTELTSGAYASVIELYRALGCGWHPD